MATAMAGNSSDRLSNSSTSSSTSSSSGESLDDLHRDLSQADVILGYQFEPRREPR